MKIFVTGANGFIAREIIQALLAKGHKVIACARNAKQLKDIFPNMQTIHCDFLIKEQIQELESALQQADVLINCVGIFRARSKKIMWKIHAEHTNFLFDLARKSNINKIIHISALGCDKVNIDYAASKLNAEKHLQSLDCDSVIFRPSLVYGQGTYGGTSLFRGLSGLPFILPTPGNGQQKLQPIHINDLACMVVNSLELKGKQLIEAVGPETLSLKQILQKTRAWLGFAKARVLSIPLFFIKSLCKIGDIFQSTAINSTGYFMLSQDNLGKPDALVKIETQLHIKPQSFHQGLYRVMSGVQDRWHAKLYFLAPLLRLSLSFMWLFSGLTSWFFYPHAISFELLNAAGITGSLQTPLLAISSLIDIIFGLLLFFNYRLRIFGTLQILLIIIYSIIVAIKLPSYWLHPFAPMIKNIPIVAATLVMMAMGSKR